MTKTIRCPDCGRENPSEAERCQHCGFPLEAEPTEVPPAASSSEPAAPFYGLPLRRRPRRPPRAGAEALSLWLVFGTIMALVVIYVAVKANVDRSQPAVQGANPAQQVSSDSLRQVLDQDSSNVEARVRLGDVLYDTANWPEAIIHYRAALRRDSSLVNALVDLGVCYYNLSDGAEAERHFLLALQRDPHHPVALFNLGIVYEQRKDPTHALEYYHRALESDPPPEMRQPLIEAVNRIQDQAAKAPGRSGG
jgi:cytochrome c-type biogenesis protein CcmH/NrfG